MRPYYNYDNGRSGFGGMNIRFHFGWTTTIKALIISNALIFLATLVVARREPRIILWLGFNRDLFLSGFIWQPITYMFIHGGLWHLLGNMLGLFFFGGDVERHLGRRNFLIMYFLCGVVGAMLSMIDPPPGAVIGASGGVFGVLIAFAVLFPDARLILFPIPIPIKARYLAVFYCFITVASLLGTGNDGIAHWAHLGGIAVGYLFIKGRPLGGRLKLLWRARRALTHERRSAAEQAELDRILEKVHREGIIGLSNRERDFLNAMSRKYKGRD